MLLSCVFWLSSPFIEGGGESQVIASQPCPALAGLSRGEAVVTLKRRARGTLPRVSVPTRRISIRDARLGW